MKIARSFQHRQESAVHRNLERLHNQLEETLVSQFSPTPPGSPVILSLAKQVANSVRVSTDNPPKLSNEMLLHRCISDNPSSPSIMERQGGVDTEKSTTCSNSSSTSRTVRLARMEFETVCPPLWIDSSDNKAGVDSELISTYKYPRFFTRDPVMYLTEIMDDFGMARFRLVQQMETTLKHVQASYWKAVLGDRQHNEAVQSFDPLAKHGSKQKSKTGSTSSFRVVTAVSAQSFLPNTTPKNVWSEPSASTMHVRGKTYAKDGVKIESETSIFSVLGVDSFVTGDKREVTDASAGTKCYLRRWENVCGELGLSYPPFLLIINFIVPWGNFQAYMIRPDADEGPFSSRHRNRPSEKAWRSFLDGNTEYRNERLKLIPRVCAGPWVVKKVVGSTPALIGTKLPVTYRGSVSENYLEIILDVTQGPALGNSVANTVVGKADAVTVDLGFVIEGQGEDGHLPEQLLSLIRFHHLNMAEAPTRSQWIQKFP